MATREGLLSGMRKPRRCVRRTEPLPQMYAPRYTPPKATLDCGKCTSPPQSAYCPAHAGNLVLKLEENKFFRRVTVALAEAYGQGYVSDAIHWLLHKFNVDLVDTLRAFKAAACLMCPSCHCSFTQPIACIHSLAATAAEILLSQ